MSKKPEKVELDNLYKYSERYVVKQSASDKRVIT